jgi:hypothetical protein
MGVAMDLDLSPTRGLKRKADDAESTLNYPRKIQVIISSILDL